MAKESKFLQIDDELFKKYLSEKQIRGASLEDVSGTHHSLPIYEHPRTKQPFVALKGSEASKAKRK